MKLLLTWLVVVGAALGGSAYWWQRDHAWWHPPASLRPDVPKVPALAPPQADPPSAALLRPLLWSTRRPPPPPRQPTEEDRLLDELQRATLLAVVQSGAQQVALLRLGNGAVVRWSESTQPWRLESFDGRVATFVSVGGLRASRPLLRAPSPPPTGLPKPR